MKPTSMVFLHPPALLTPALLTERAASPFRKLALLGLCGAVALAAHAQGLRGDSAAMPDAPSAVMAAQATGSQQAATGPTTGTGGQYQQTKRILGVFPNFRAVSADTKLPPQSVKEKFTATAQQTFDYSDLPLVLVLAGVAESNNSEPSFGQGAAGYGQYLWRTSLDQADENFWVQAILPSVLHEDSRYYTLGHGGIARRTLYAFDRTLITRTDSQKETFNFSEIVGAGAASGISDAYYPLNEATWTKTGQRWLTNVLIDGGTYIFQEFWPDVNDKLFHTKD